jgi:hypothetical protein
VQLVAHVQSAFHDRPQRDPARAAHRGRYHRRYDMVNIIQPLPHPLIVYSIVKPARIGTFVKVAVSRIAVLGVPHNEDRHRRCIDARQRPHRAELLTATQDDSAACEFVLGLGSIAHQTLEQRAAYNGIALATDVVLPWHRRSRGQDCFGRHTRHRFARGRDIDQYRLGLD